MKCARLGSSGWTMAVDRFFLDLLISCYLPCNQENETEGLIAVSSQHGADGEHIVCAADHPQHVGQADCV